VYVARIVVAHGAGGLANPGQRAAPCAQGFSYEIAKTIAAGAIREGHKRGGSNTSVMVVDRDGETLVGHPAQTSLIESRRAALTLAQRLKRYAQVALRFGPVEWDVLVSHCFIDIREGWCELLGSANSHET
jgi:hypothetical protein